MSEQVKHIISYEGTSILFEHSVDLATNNLVRNDYLMRDWKTVSISITANTSGASGNVKVMQSMRNKGTTSEISTGAKTITIADGDEVGLYDVPVGGAYLVLDFSGATLPATGIITITVLGKRS
jgi:hypothetical protein